MRRHVFPILKTLLFFLAVSAPLAPFAQKVDYSTVSVPEENGLELMKITRESDYVCFPKVKRTSNGVDWITNRILAVSPDGQSIAYLSVRENSTNIFIKDIDKQSSSRKRTNRASIVDFTYSPDGKKICFTEMKGKFNQLFITDAVNGYVCKQITTDSKDYSPIYSSDMKNIFFTRLENRGASVWSFNVDDKFLSTYSPGLNPCPTSDPDILFIARSGKGQSQTSVAKTIPTHYKTKCTNTLCATYY